MKPGLEVVVCEKKQELWSWKRRYLRRRKAKHCATPVCFSLRAVHNYAAEVSAEMKAHMVCRLCEREVRASSRMVREGGELSRCLELAGGLYPDAETAAVALQKRAEPLRRLSQTTISWARP